MFYGGDLSYLEPEIYGYKPEGRGCFKVTFNELTDAVKKLERDLFFGKNVVLKNANGKKIMVDVVRPRVPLKTVTLRPVPLEYDLDKLTALLTNLTWGKPVSVTRGVHRQVGNRRRLKNEYVHVKYPTNDLNENAIPPAIDIEGHYVYVTKPNETVRTQCDYCHGYWHSEAKCYKKRRDMEAMALAQHVECSFCGESSHSEDTCMAKIQAEQEEINSKISGRSDALRTVVQFNNSSNVQPAISTPVVENGPTEVHSPTNQSEVHKTNVLSTPVAEKDLQEKLASSSNQTDVAPENDVPVDEKKSSNEKVSSSDSSAFMGFPNKDFHEHTLSSIDIDTEGTSYMVEHEIKHDSEESDCVSDNSESRQLSELSSGSEGEGHTSSHQKDLTSGDDADTEMEDVNDVPDQERRKKRRLEKSSSPNKTEKVAKLTKGKKKSAKKKKKRL